MFIMSQVMYLPVDEQETHISLDRYTNKAIIYTTDTKMRNRLKKLYPDKLTKTYTQDGFAIGEEYIIDPRMISFRSKLPDPRPLTDEERERRRQFMKALREKQLAEKKRG
jgi:hypothetical protein